MKIVHYAKESRHINNQTSDIVAVGMTEKKVIEECHAMYDCGISPQDKQTRKGNKFYVNGEHIFTIKTKKMKDDADINTLLSTA
jgi:hypothetical protein